MEQTDNDLHVLVLPARDVRMAATGLRILADVIEKGVGDMIEADRKVETIAEMIDHRDHARELADRLDEEAGD